jgi:hypothetical protein
MERKMENIKEAFYEASYLLQKLQAAYVHAKPIEGIIILALVGKAADIRNAIKALMEAMEAMDSKD